mmetsp:Transcript_20994/g.58113  ORF Transcript_20994/g.58113 Transcript_20994/m.58113 type:complete len:638 (+) Transcript_20994:135-2048(+)
METSGINLHQQIQQHRNDLGPVAELLNSSPVQGLLSKQKRPGDSYLPLHSALKHGAGPGLTELVQCLLVIFPQAAQEKVGPCDELPIHFACRRHPSAVGCPVIACLIDAFPSCVRYKDASGNLPLHQILPSNQLDVVTTIFNAYPEAAYMANSKREIPIHIAAEHCSNKDIAALLIDKYPDGLKQTDSNGKVPLYRAVASNKSCEIIDLMTGTYQEAAPSLLQSRRGILHLAKTFPDAFSTACKCGQNAKNCYCLRSHPILQYLSSKAIHVGVRDKVKGMLRLCSHSVTENEMQPAAETVHPRGNSKKDAEVQSSKLESALNEIECLKEELALERKGSDVEKKVVQSQKKKISRLETELSKANTLGHSQTIKVLQNQLEEADTRLSVTEKSEKSLLAKMALYADSKWSADDLKCVLELLVRRLAREIRGRSMSKANTAHADWSTYLCADTKKECLEAIRAVNSKLSQLEESTAKPLQPSIIYDEADDMKHIKPEPLWRAVGNHDDSSDDDEPLAEVFRKHQAKRKDSRNPANARAVSAKPDIVASSQTQGTMADIDRTRIPKKASSQRRAAREKLNAEESGGAAFRPEPVVSLHRPLVQPMKKQKKDAKRKRDVVRSSGKKTNSTPQKRARVNVDKC